MKLIIITALIAFSLLSGLTYSLYVFYIREAFLFWSNLSDQEKLIHFRTENALYYSYFQDFIRQSSIIGGFKQLISNNVTEHPENVNVIRRMNIWPEIILGLLYRSLSYIRVKINPIDFYTNSVMLHQSLTIASSILLASSISSSFLSGVLCAVLLAINRASLSRISDFVALRENFALPFWWVHLLMCHLMIRPRKPRHSIYMAIRVVFMASTFLFCLSWQFSQFIFLLESLVIFSLHSLEQIPSHLNHFYHKCVIGSLLLTSVFQCFNPMLISSFTLTFAIASMLIAEFKPPNIMHSSFSGRLTWLSIQGTSRFILAIILKSVAMLIIPHNDDSHITNFVLAKFGLGDRRDFSTNLYFCNAAFDWLSIDSYLGKLTYVGIPTMLVYLCLCFVVHFSALSVLWHDTEEEVELGAGYRETLVSGEGDYCDGCSHLLGNRPELFYHFGMFSLLSFMCLIVSRMQYFITPYIIVLSTMVLCDWTSYKFVYNNVADLFTSLTVANAPSVDSIVTETTFTPDESEPDNESGDIVMLDHQYTLRARNNGLVKQKPQSAHPTVRISPYDVMDGVRVAFIVGMVATILMTVVKDVSRELKQLGEFYDPHTVELMNWIEMNSDPADAFAGSMQLMAAVKLVTQRPIANHPHFENSLLREKTRQIYQIYGHVSIKDVHSILRNYQIDYIIIENSICYQKRNYCTTNDIVDISNKHIPTNPFLLHLYYYELFKPVFPRFCESLETVIAKNQFHTRLFELQYSNPAFRVYRVVKSD